MLFVLLFVVFCVFVFVDWRVLCVVSACLLFIVVRCVVCVACCLLFFDSCVVFVWYVPMFVVIDCFVCLLFVGCYLLLVVC